MYSFCTYSQLQLYRSPCILIVLDYDHYISYYDGPLPTICVCVLFKLLFYFSLRNSFLREQDRGATTYYTPSLPFHSLFLPYLTSPSNLNLNHDILTFNSEPNLNPKFNIYIIILSFKIQLRRLR